MKSVTIDRKTAWMSLVKDACRDAVESRMRRMSWKRLVERSELCRLADCCLAFGFNNKDLPFAVVDWDGWFQHPVQLQYTERVVNRLAAQPLMAPEQTASELRKAYTEMLVEREVARRLEGER